MYLYSPNLGIVSTRRRAVRSDQLEGLLVVGLTFADFESSPALGKQVLLQEAVCVSSLADAIVEDTVAVAIVAAPLLPLFCDSIQNLSKELRSQSSTFIVLVKRRLAPTAGVRNDGVVDSFVCTVDILRKIIRVFAPLSVGKLDHLCYKSICDLANGNNIGCQRLLVKQLPVLTSVPSDLSVLPRIDLIMAHRGESAHLEASLRYIRGNSNWQRILIHVGLDTDCDSNLRDVVHNNAPVAFFQVRPTPMGPYVVRQHLIDSTRQQLIGFHDSDDISTHDRFSVMTGELESLKCDMVGCHELRLNEISGHVEAIRFPLNVNNSLRDDPGRSCFLYASALCCRQAFERTGGFSTNYKIANDTQFLFRAFFHLHIRNSDNFLYIRRMHRNGLSIQSHMCDKLTSRAEMRRNWERAFKEVLSGRRSLTDSILGVIRTNENYQLFRILAKSSGSVARFETAPDEVSLLSDERSASI